MADEVRKAGLWRIAEAAGFLGVSERSVKNMLAAGQLPETVVIRLGRRRLFHPGLLLRWAEDRARGPRRKSG